MINRTIQVAGIANVAGAEGSIDEKTCHSSRSVYVRNEMKFRYITPAYSYLSRCGSECRKIISTTSRHLDDATIRHGIMQNDDASSPRLLLPRTEIYNL